MPTYLDLLFNLRRKNNAMLGPVTDETLVARAVAGSNSAWNKLIKRYEKRVYNYALRMVSHPDDAFDLMQEVFMGVHRNLANFRGDAPFPAWLFRIAAFRCTDYLRRRRAHEEFDEQQGYSSPTAGPEALTFATHTNQKVSAALRDLPFDQRQVVELKFFQHFTFEDIAGQLGISANTAKTRLYSALRKLKQHEELRDAL